jgi:hypothetical protein
VTNVLRLMKACFDTQFDQESPKRTGYLLQTIRVLVFIIRFSNTMKLRNSAVLLCVMNGKSKPRIIELG